MSTFDLFRHDFVFSVHPKYAAKIVAGEKTVELRRRFPEATATGSVAYIYASSPIQALVGWARINEIRYIPVSVIWEELAPSACITKADFERYFSGVDHGFAVMLAGARAFRSPVLLAELRTAYGFVPPQSFCYAGADYRRLLENEDKDTH